MYEIMFCDDSHATATAASLDGAIDKIAAVFGRHRSEVGLDDRSSGCGTVEQYDAWLAGCGDHGDPVAVISELEEPPPGWEARALERAQREGVLTAR